MTLRIIYSLANFSVLQWQDTDRYSYAEPADGMGVMGVTPMQWASQDVLRWVVNGQLTADAPVLVIPPPSAAEVLAAASVKLQQASQLAAAQKGALTERIGQIEDAIDFGDPTQAELTELPTRQAQLAAWKRYSTLLGRVTAQSGWPATITWPTEPAEGMDLTVSAVVQAS